MKRNIIIIVYFFCTIATSLFSPSSCFSTSKPFLAKVDYVFDGDTILIKKGKERLSIRLWGIDCPERAQPYGNLSQKYLEDLILNKSVVVDIYYKDDFNRNVANVTLGKKNINEHLISKGLAWVHPYYCKRNVCKAWSRSEALAKKKKLGLWAGDNPLPPWVYKRKNK